MTGCDFAQLGEGDGNPIGLLPGEHLTLLHTADLEHLPRQEDAALARIIPEGAQVSGQRM